MTSVIKYLDRNYNYWFSSPIWQFLKTKIENRTKSHQILLVWFGFRIKLKIIIIF